MTHIEGLDDYLDRIPTSKDALIAAALPEYRKLVRQYDPALERTGRNVVRQVAGSAYRTIFKEVTQPNAPEPPPSLVEQLLDPVTTPFARGASAEMQRVLKPLVLGGGVLFVMSCAGLFLLGRWSR